MRLTSIRDSSIDEVNERAGVFVAACGYERRSSAIANIMTLPPQRIALCFKELSHALSRSRNEADFSKRSYSKHLVSGDDSTGIQDLVAEFLTSSTGKRAIAFDISAMTRVWHSAIIRQLRVLEADDEIDVFFTYVPGQFSKPKGVAPTNEFVGPVPGFASLGTPDRPVAAVIGLGYERDRALGLEQLLDPRQTVLFVPRSGQLDPFYEVVKRSNDMILKRTTRDWIFEYSIKEPSATFATAASIISGLSDSYRVVLASLGPKIFGLICFLLASRIPDVSVWRVSSGAHAEPKDVEADMTKVVVLHTTWGPE